MRGKSLAIHLSCSSIIVLAALAVLPSNAQSQESVAPKMPKQVPTANANQEAPAIASPGPNEISAPPRMPKRVPPKPHPPEGQKEPAEE